LNATNPAYSVFSLTTNNSGETYSVTVSNGVNGATSSNAVLTVLPDGPPDVRSGLVSYWPLDAVSNTAGIYTTPDLYSADDFLLFNMDGSNVQPGQFGNSLGFDNLANTYATRTHGFPIYNTNGYSVAMWVKGDGSFQAEARVYSEGSTNSNVPLFTIGTGYPASPAGLAEIFIRNDAGGELVSKNSTRTVFDNNWHHLVWTDVGGQGKLYVDGVLDETDFSYTPSPLTLNVTALGAVVRAAPSAMIFADIDETAIWNRALSSTEIQIVKNSSLPAPLGAIRPTFVTQPAGTNVFTRANVDALSPGRGDVSIFLSVEQGQYSFV